MSRSLTREEHMWQKNDVVVLPARERERACHRCHGGNGDACLTQMDKMSRDKEVSQSFSRGSTHPADTDRRVDRRPNRSDNNLISTGRKEGKLPTERRLTYSVCYARTLWEAARSKRVETEGEGGGRRGHCKAGRGEKESFWDRGLQEFIFIIFLS